MIGGKTRVFAILGSPVGHSLSPAMHNAAFRALGLDAVYVPFCCDAADLGPLLGALARSGGGGNITVPHKEQSVTWIDQPAQRVTDLGACNTFWVEGAKVFGDNTDVDGVLAALERLEAPATSWYLAGTGGGAKAVVAAARELGASVAIRSRDLSRRHRFEQWVTAHGVRLTAASECEVLINATPLGLNPGDHLPIALDEAPRASVAFDMVYTRGETTWVRNMRLSGLRASDGRYMLVAQGGAAFTRWFPEEDAPLEIMRAVVDEALR